MGSGMARELDGSSLHAYRRSLANVQVLDRDAERELARRWIAGDKRAGKKIVEACLPLISLPPLAPPENEAFVLSLPYPPA